MRVDLIQSSKAAKPCQGIVYRARLNNYYHKGVYVEKLTMTPLKSKSCPGCDSCGWLVDAVTEYVAATGGIQFKEGIEHTKMYTIGICNESCDRETGVVEDYDLQFVEYTE